MDGPDGAELHSGGPEWLLSDESVVLTCLLFKSS